MGINLGAFFSPLSAARSARKSAGTGDFASAGVGMLFAVSQFALGQRTLGAAGLPAGKRELDARDWLQVAAIGVADGAARLFSAGRMGECIRGVEDHARTSEDRHSLAMAFAGFFAWQRGSCSREEWRRLMAIVIMGVFVIFFWMGFEQAGGTMNLFADKLTDRSLFGWDIPASYFQGDQPAPHRAAGPAVFRDVDALGPLALLRFPRRRKWDSA